MKIFVINLDRRPDRLATMTERLNRLELKFERICAFDGNAKSVEHLVLWKKAFFFHYMKWPTLGAIGCYQSHKFIWQKIVDERIPQALVFEDDAELHDWDPKILNVNISDLGLEVLRLEASDLSSKTPLTSGTELLGRKFYNTQTASSGAYLITESGAQTYLLLGKFFIAADNYDLVSRFTGLKTAVLLPVMSRQGGSISDLSVQKKTPTTRLEKGLSTCADVWWRIRRPWVRAARKIAASFEVWNRQRKNLVNK